MRYAIPPQSEKTIVTVWHILARQYLLPRPT